MRAFEGGLAAGQRETIIALASQILTKVQAQPVTGAEYAMEPADRVVMHQVDMELLEGRLRVGMTEPDARPPFEWEVEITSELGESDYWKHYLVQAHDIVLAHRRELTPIDAAEAEMIISELEAVLQSLAA